MFMTTGNDRGPGIAQEGIVLRYALSDGYLGRFTGGGPFFYQKKNVPPRSPGLPVLQSTPGTK